MCWKMNQHISFARYPTESRSDLFDRWGVWIFAALGIVYSFILLEKYKLLETLLYVAQGLLPALAIASTTDG